MNQNKLIKNKKKLPTEGKGNSDNKKKLPVQKCLRAKL